MPTLAEFSLYLRVYDAERLYTAAANHDDADLAELRAADGSVNISACLRTLLDPGVSPAGCDILDSSAEVTTD